MSDFMKIGDKYVIHGYKHNGKIYKTWDEAVYLDEQEDYYVFGNNNTKVTKKYGSSWSTKEAAILFYYKKEWFNVVAQLKSNGIYFYCNISSPVVIEEDTKTIKFIDYDLDLRIFPDDTYKILDKSEYEYHKKIMKYTDELDKILKYELDKLITKFNSNDIIFNKDVIFDYHRKYIDLKKEEKE